MIEFYNFGITTAFRMAWWRHQMEIFSALLAICAGNSPVPGEFPTQRPVTRSFDVFFDLGLNKRLSKQWRGWWFETLSCPLWHHRNGQRAKLHSPISVFVTMSRRVYSYRPKYVCISTPDIISQTTGWFLNFCRRVHRNTQDGVMH